MYTYDILYKIDISGNLQVEKKIMIFTTHHLYIEVQQLDKDIHTGTCILHMTH